MIVFDILTAFYVAAWCYLPLYGVLLSGNYMGERDRAGDLSYSRFVMLLLSTIGFAVIASRADFRLLNNAIRVVAFVVFVALGGVTLAFLGLDMYRKANRDSGKGSIVTALLAVVYVVMVVFSTSGKDENIDSEIEVIDSEAYQTGYDDGYSDGESSGYYDGYAEGHREAQEHSERYEELLRQAYEATGGKGAGFKEEDGMIFVEETTPSGRKVWVYFEP